MNFEELALPLLSPLYTYARWLTHDAHEAEDLVQETYLKGLRGFASFAPGTNFRAWMYRILRNTFLTSRSGLKVQVSIDDEPERFELGVRTRQLELDPRLLDHRSSPLSICVRAEYSRTSE